MNPAELINFAKTNGIDAIGWFKGGEFPNYLQAIDERVEYHKFNYRPYRDFIAAGKPGPRIKTVITIAADYFYEKAGLGSGFKISNYSRFCWNTVEPKADFIIQFLRSRGYNAERVDLPERAAACKAGLGFIGKNCLLYAYQLGSYVGIRSIASDIELEESGQGSEYVTSPGCINCNRCIEACPTKAIYPKGYQINPLKCLSFLNRHPDEPLKEVPRERLKLDGWLHGCEVCQEVCPQNMVIKHAGDVVFNPELEYFGLKVKNSSTVSEEILREKLAGVALAHYRAYLLRLLGEIETF